MDVLSYALSKKYTDEQIAEQKLKVAKVEKELNDYKSVMAQVNINQEAKQKASGYGIIPLPKNAANGQVSDVVLKGNTINQLANNGVNYANWTGTGVTADANGIHFLGDGVTKVASLSTALKPSTEYTIILRITKWVNPSTTLMTTNGNNAFPLNQTIASPGTLGLIKKKLTTVSTITVNALMLRFGGLPAGEQIDITDIMIVEGDQTSNPVTDKYVSYGTKSTVSASRLKSVGKNLIPNNVLTQGFELGSGHTDSDVHKYIKLEKVLAGTYQVQIANPNFADLRIRVTSPKNNSVTSAYHDNKYIFTISSDTTLFINVRYADSRSWLEKVSSGQIWLQLARSNQVTSYEPYTESNMYLPNVGELRSLPNGVKDEFNVTTGKATIRIGHKTDVASGTVINYVDMAEGGTYYAWNEDGETETGIKGDTLGIDATTLIYQLATPIEIPIQISGSLVSYPSGTVYIEPFVADAGVYTDKMSVLHQDLPINALEKISKVDFETGVETELDVSETVIAGDKLSFTHPDLEAGDSVFFVYEYDRESTIGETEIEYYDSRYVVKDDVTEKFYKWAVAVSDGVPSIQLTEV